MNLIDFKVGDTVGEIYQPYTYKIINISQNGMAQVYNITLNRYEEWNACNNNRFFKLEGQLKINFR